MMTRRHGLIGMVVGLLAFPAKWGKWDTKLRYPPPLWYWYEDKHGNVWEPTDAHFRGDETPPSGFEYMHSRSADLQHHIESPDFRGSITSSSGWSEGLALAFANDGYRLRDAIAIASIMCERCVNAAAHDYGLEWGYARYSEQWRRSHTRCEYCKEEEDRRIIDQLVARRKERVFPPRGIV